MDSALGAFAPQGAVQDAQRVDGAGQRLELVGAEPGHRVVDAARPRRLDQLLFAYIAASPFVMQGMLGLSSGVYSLLFGLTALVIVITSAVAAALAGRIPYRRMIGAGLSAGLLTATGLLVLSLNGVPMVATLVLFALFQGAMGLVFSNATALALEQAGENAGTGSAFLGFLQFMLAALISPWWASGVKGPPYRWVWRC